MNQVFRIIPTIVFLAFLSGCASRGPIVSPGAEPRTLKEICSRYNIRLDWDTVSQIITLSRQGQEAKAMLGSRSVMLNNTRRIELDGPIEQKGHQVFVPLDFHRKVIDELLKKEDYSLKRFHRIAIDAGHGGKDPGAMSRSGLKEKEVTLDISKRLRRILEEKGMQVLMTRTRDEFISLEDRTRLASRGRADLFVSIHANAHPSRGIKGMEVYFLRNKKEADWPEPVLRENCHALTHVLRRQMPSPVLDKILLDMLYTYKQNESIHLAKKIVKETSGSLHNRGVKASGFFVLRNTLVPAVLVEVGFLTNKEEEKLLRTAFYRQKLAEILAESILNYASEY